jgi:hypothetical protein
MLMYSSLVRRAANLNAGRPTKQPVDSPLGAVVLAVEQRDRLARLLNDEGVDAHLTTLIITQLKLPGSIEAIPEDTEVVEGWVFEAVKELEFHVRQGGHFTVSGLVFAIETESGADVVTFTLERSPEGQAALLTKTNELRVSRQRRK